MNEGTLDGAKLSVKSDKEHADTDEDNNVPHPSGEPFVQSDKPRAGSKYMLRIVNVRLED